MTKQIEAIMALARQWVEARTKGQGGSSQQDALRQALEAALKPGEPAGVEELHGSIMGAAYDFRDAHLTGSKNLKRTAHEILDADVRKALTAAPPAQTKQLDSDESRLTPPPRLTDDEIIEIANLGLWKSDSDITSDGLDIARAIETAVRRQFGYE